MNAREVTKLTAESQILRDIEYAEKELGKALLARKKPDEKTLTALNIGMNTLDGCAKFIRWKQQQAVPAGGVPREALEALRDRARISAADGSIGFREQFMAGHFAAELDNILATSNEAGTPKDSGS